MNDDDVFCPKCGNKVGSSKVKKSNENVDEHFISESLVTYFDGANALELKKYAIEQIIEKIDTELTKAKDSCVNYTLWSQSNVNRINELKKKINNYKEASFVKEVARETQFN